METATAYITRPLGFKASGVSAGLKGEGLLDVGLVVSECPCNAAGVYTSNLVKGHSLQRSIDILNKKQKIRGMITNSKNANAAVGPAGLKDADDIASAVAGELGCSADEILTASTGVIGFRMPTDKIISAVPSLVSSLGNDYENAHNAELAMMTTDTVPKEVCAEVTFKDNSKVTIAAIAKGSGMIHPNLATMISIFTTDADIETDLLYEILKNAVKHTFNRVSVDGDTSVCDEVVIMANGMSGVKIEKGSEDYDIFAEAVTDLANDIARIIASDGEGATKFVEIECFNAKTEKDAYLVVSAVAKSPLCKTAIFGMDANCGRILTAAGYSGADFDPDKIDIRLNRHLFYKDGIAVPFDEDEAAKLLKVHDIKIEIDLKDGACYDRMYTCDFSYEYVRINGDYRS